jgi:hypothetical protein
VCDVQDKLHKAILLNTAKAGANFSLDLKADTVATQACDPQIFK